MPSVDSRIYSVLFLMALSVFPEFTSAMPGGTHEAHGETHEQAQWHSEARIIKINPEKEKLLLAHQDIPGLMPAMTMAFSVADLTLDSTTVSDLRENDTIAIDFSKMEGNFSIHRIAILSKSTIKNTNTNLNPEILWQHPLIDQHNNPVKLDDFRGKILLINFIYTHCPTVCPVQTANLARLENKLRKREMAGIHLVSISLDPKRDTPARLLEFANKYLTFTPQKEINWSFLTGEYVTVRQVTNSLNAAAFKQSKNELEHWVGIHLIDQSGNISATYHGDNFDPLVVIGDIEGLLKR